MCEKETEVKGMMVNGVVFGLYDDYDEVLCPLEQVIDQDRAMALSKIELFTSNDTRCLDRDKVCPFLSSIKMGWPHVRNGFEDQVIDVWVHCCLVVEDFDDAEYRKKVELIVDQFINKHSK